MSTTCLLPVHTEVPSDIGGACVLIVLLLQRGRWHGCCDGAGACVLCVKMHDYSWHDSLMWGEEPRQQYRGGLMHLRRAWRVLVSTLAACIMQALLCLSDAIGSKVWLRSSSTYIVMSQLC